MLGIEPGKMIPLLHKYTVLLRCTTTENLLKGRINLAITLGMTLIIACTNFIIIFPLQSFSAVCGRFSGNKLVFV